MTRSRSKREGKERKKNDSGSKIKKNVSIKSIQAEIADNFGRSFIQYDNERRKRNKKENVCHVNEKATAMSINMYEGNCGAMDDNDKSFVEKT